MLVAVGVEAKQVGSMLPEPVDLCGSGGYRIGLRYAERAAKAAGIRNDGMARVPGMVAFGPGDGDRLPAPAELVGDQGSEGAEREVARIGDVAGSAAARVGSRAGAADELAPSTGRFGRSVMVPPSRGSARLRGSLSGQVSTVEFERSATARQSRT